MRKRFVFLLVLIGSIPLIGSFFISFNLLHNTMHSDFYSLNESKLETFTIQTQEYVDKHMAVVRVIARSIPVRHFDLPAVSQMLNDYKKIYPDIDLVLSDAKGNQVIRGDREQLTKIPNHYFHKEAMKGREEVVSEYLISQRNGAPLVVLATPVRSENGSIIGVLQANLYLGILKNLVAERSVNGVVAYILDQEGKIIVHPDEHLTSVRKDMSQLPFVQKALQGKGGSVEVTEVTEGKQRKLINYTYDPRTRWVICVEKTFFEYEQVCNSLQWANVMIFAVTVLAIVCISIIFLSDKIGMDTPIE